MPIGTRGRVDVLLDAPLNDPRLTAGGTPGSIGWAMSTGLGQWTDPMDSFTGPINSVLTSAQKLERAGLPADQAADEGKMIDEQGFDRVMRLFGRAAPAPGVEVNYSDLVNAIGEYGFKDVLSESVTWANNMPSQTPQSSAGATGANYIPLGAEPLYTFPTFETTTTPMEGMKQGAAFGWPGAIGGLIGASLFGKADNVGPSQQFTNYTTQQMGPIIGGQTAPLIEQSLQLPPIDVTASAVTPNFNSPTFTPGTGGLLGSGQGVYTLSPYGVTANRPAQSESVQPALNPAEQAIAHYWRDSRGSYDRGQTPAVCGGCRAGQ